MTNITVVTETIVIWVQKNHLIGQNISSERIQESKVPTEAMLSVNYEISECCYPVNNNSSETLQC